MKSTSPKVQFFHEQGEILSYPITAFQVCERDSDWKQDMHTALGELLVLLKDDHAISAYELHSSGLVQALFNCLNVSDQAFTLWG